jgi:hypothetical protein
MNEHCQCWHHDRLALNSSRREYSDEGMRRYVHQNEHQPQDDEQRKQQDSYRVLSHAFHRERPYFGSTRLNYPPFANLAEMVSAVQARSLNGLALARQACRQWPINRIPDVMAPPMSEIVAVSFGQSGHSAQTPRPARKNKPRRSGVHCLRNAFHQNL